MFPTRWAIVMLVAGFMPSVIVITRGLQARVSPWKIAAAGVRAANLVPFFAAFFLPVPRVAQLVLIAAGVSLGVWDISVSIRDYRRSKAAERAAKA